MNLSEHRRTFARELVTVLETNFTEKLGAQSEWWESHVISQLSYGQRGQVRFRGIERLGQLDLHALLRVFDRNWGELSYWCSLAKNDYPPIDRDEVYKEIFEQAENFKKYRSA